MGDKWEVDVEQIDTRRGTWFIRFVSRSRYRLPTRVVSEHEADDCSSQPEPQSEGVPWTLTYRTMRLERADKMGHRELSLSCVSNANGRTIAVSGAAESLRLSRSAWTLSIVSVSDISPGPETVFHPHFR
jgi:hypothetical protein